MLLDLVLRWTHILSAVMLAGGLFFLRSAMLAAQESAAASAREAFDTVWRPRWARWVMLTSGLLLASGLYNSIRNIITQEFEGPLYHGLVGLKLLLALVLFWIAATLAGRSAVAQRLRARYRSWLNLAVILAILLILVAGYMRSVPRRAKPLGPAVVAPSEPSPIDTKGASD